MVWVFGLGAMGVGGLLRVLDLKDPQDLQEPEELKDTKTHYNSGRASGWADLSLSIGKR